MIETQNVLHQNILIRVNDGDKEYVATAHRTRSDELLGYIRFEKAKGT